ncbi:MAG TPA: response regulator [Bacteroidales bacterium]|mgnify:CR=1 FL=1|nr:response regulator [Bacteroidales bacterium]
MEKEMYQFAKGKETIVLDNDPWIVYVVDDDPNTLKSTELALDDFTYNGKNLKLHFFTNAADTIASLKVAGPAVILLDIVMENDKSGFEVVNFLRHHQKNKLTQIIICTGQAGKTIMFPHEIALGYEINGFIDKTDKNYYILRAMVTTSLRIFELQNQLILSNKRLEVLNSSLIKFFNLTKNNNLQKTEEKRLLVQIIFDQINKHLYQDEKVLSPEGCERLASLECDNIIYLHTIISKALKSSKKTRVITDKDIARAEETPLLMWQKEESWLKKLHKALCGEKIGDMGNSVKLIDTETPYEVFKDHHYGIPSYTHIKWLGDLGSLLYLYFALHEENTQYIADNGVWSRIHEELKLHYLYKEQVLKPDVLKQTKALNIEKSYIPDTINKMKFIIVDRWIGDTRHKKTIDEIIENLEE